MAKLLLSAIAAICESKDFSFNRHIVQFHAVNQPAAKGRALSCILSEA
jgi:hypothetical protein